MNNFYVALTELDETKTTMPLDIPLPEYSLNLLSTSPLEVETVLQSAGPDAINNHALIL